MGMKTIVIVLCWIALLRSGKVLGSRQLSTSLNRAEDVCMPGYWRQSQNHSQIIAYDESPCVQPLPNELLRSSRQAPVSYIRNESSAHDYATLSKFDNFHDNYKISELTLLGLGIVSELNEYCYLKLHQYERAEDMRLAAGPQVNQERCLRQLTDLNQRATKLSTEKQYSKDINFISLLDTFGHEPSGHHLGNFMWEGSYAECRRLKIHSSSSQSSSGTRYCIARLRDVAWPAREKVASMAIHSGVCLPESCDSVDYKNKYDLIAELRNHKVAESDQGRYKVSGLYCLPDEKSPLRSIWRDQSALLASAAVAFWMALLVYATAKDYQCGADEGSWLKSFSIIDNINRLFQVTDSQEQSSGTKHSVNFDIFESIKVIAMSYVILGHVIMLFTGGLIDTRQLGKNPAFLVANLAPAFAVNSFFAMTGILTAYLLLKQNRLKPFLTSPVKWFAIIFYRYIRLMPMYLLIVLYSKTLAKYTNSGPYWDYGTSSLSHRRHCEQESIVWTLLLGANFKRPVDHCLPGGWYLANDFQFFLITPVFLILLENYSKLAKRLMLSCMALGICGSMLSILTAEIGDLRAIANFEPHAFKTYVTHLSHNYTRPYYRIPAYLIGLYVGYLLFDTEQARLGSGDTRPAQEQETSKTSGRSNDLPICNVLIPMTFITPVLIRQLGLEFQGTIANIMLVFVISVYLTIVYVGLSLLLSYTPASNDTAQANPSSNRFQRYSCLIGATIIYSCCITPFLSSSISLTKTAARISMSIILTFHNFSFALAICLITLYSCTSQRSRSLAHRIFTAHQWKVLSRLSFSALLLNVEVITYIAGGREHLHPLTQQYLWGMNLVSVIMTYFVSIFVYVLVESPLQSVLRRLIPLLMKANNATHQPQSDKQNLKCRYNEQQPTNTIHKSKCM